MADFAEGFTDENDNPAPLPPELAQAFLIEQWGASAVYDGVLPARQLKRMSASLNIYRALKSYHAGAHRLADWARANEGYARIVTDIREMRLQNA